MKLLSGVAIINDSIGKRVVYTYSEIDETGNLLDSNKKESFIAIDEETKIAIQQLEDLIKTRLV